MLLGEGVANEVLDCGQHRGDELGVLARCVLGGCMRNQQPGMTVDQKDMLDPVNQRMFEHDLGKGRSGTPGFPTPLTAIASCSGSSSTSLKCRDSSISRPSSRVRSCSSRGSNGTMPVGSRPT